jgi:hypothetical protein
MKNTQVPGGSSGGCRTTGSSNGPHKDLEKTVAMSKVTPKECAVMIQRRKQVDEGLFG